jgi:sugar phosphate isomerase/epimerase
MPDACTAIRSNRMKNKLGCTTNTYCRFPFERALDGIAKCGLKYVELAAIPIHADHVSPERMTEADYGFLQKKLADRGLQAVSVSAHCDPLQAGSGNLVKSRILLASKVGAEFVNTVAGHPQSDDQWKHWRTEVRKLGDFARDHGVMLCLETHGAVIGRSADARRAIEMLDHSNVRINYDPANLLYYVGERPEQDIQGIVDLISHVHIKDKIGGKEEWNFPAVGRGSIDFVKVLGPLFASGYTGPLNFELEFTPDSRLTADEIDAALKQSVTHIRRLADANGW